MSTKPRAGTLISLLLLSALVCVAIPATSAQQQPQRDRRVVTASPTATPTPTPVASPTAAPSEIPQASPDATPTPSVVASRSVTTTRTLSELQARITEVLRKPEL